ncbi:MAG: xanthine dehydrogenase family protein molybdopterin-binding subunit [Armatimonadota bacterium]|nr:xanthine dehydrogenase family protein molybdopterin-binding subunit [Armatimonadota bacterium]
MGALIGRSIPRLDGIQKASGRFQYGIDLVIAGMLHGRVVRSPHPHARLRAIDTSAALAVPGVVAVVTGCDLPDRRFGALIKDETVLAVDVVRYVGQPVAAVAALSLEAAIEAAAQVTVEYDPLPAVEDPDAALRAGAPLVHEAWASYVAHPRLIRHGNVCGTATITKGDLARGMAEADHVFEDVFTTEPVHQAYLEPRMAVAAWDPPGCLTVYSNTQLPFEAQAVLADILGVSPGRVRVITTGIGGAFGGKLRIGVEHIAAVLAQRAGRPVRIALTMEEEFAAAYPRHAMRITLRTGVRRDGTIVAKEAHAVLDAGAFSGSSPGLPSVATLVLAGPYRIPNLLLEATSVYTHKQNFGSYRAPTGPQCAFAVESQMDMIARRLGLDPLAFRLRNVVRDGDVGPTGQVFGKVSLEAALRKAAAAIGWGDRTQPHHGKGLACTWWTTTGGPSGVYAKLNADGTATLATGCAEIGTGALTAAAQMFADHLGLRVEDITMISADTFATPYDHGAQGSRSAFAVGNAARAAAAEIRRQVLRLAADTMEASVSDLDISDGRVRVRGTPSRQMSLGDVVRLAMQHDGGIMAGGTFAAPATPYDTTCVSGHFYPAFNSPSFHAHAAEVAVDPETGAVEVLRYVVAQDVGRAINPRLIEGQIEGGVVQGLGQALRERIPYQGAFALVHNFGDYALPRVGDTPEIVSILIEEPDDIGPHGARGVAEPPIIGPPATIANAVDDAVGARVTNLPLWPERVLRAMRERARGGE